MQIINQYRADSLRLYLMSSPVMRSENINFNDAEIMKFVNVCSKFGGTAWYFIDSTRLLYPCQS